MSNREIGAMERIGIGAMRQKGEDCDRPSRSMEHGMGAQ